MTTTHISHLQMARCDDNEAVLKDTVYITESGSKYHRADCRFLMKTKTPIDTQDAIKQGYTPCDVCHR